MQIALPTYGVLSSALRLYQLPDENRRKNREWRHEGTKTRKQGHEATSHEATKKATETRRRWKHEDTKPGNQENRNTGKQQGLLALCASMQHAIRGPGNVPCECGAILQLLESKLPGDRRRVVLSRSLIPISTSREVGCSKFQVRSGRAANGGSGGSANPGWAASHTPSSMALSGRVSIFCFEAENGRD